MLQAARFLDSAHSESTYFLVFLIFTKPYSDNVWKKDGRPHCTTLKTITRHPNKQQNQKHARRGFEICASFLKTMRSSTV
jgi:hypothetical protein